MIDALLLTVAVFGAGVLIVIGLVGLATTAISHEADWEGPD